MGKGLDIMNAVAGAMGHGKGAPAQADQAPPDAASIEDHGGGDEMKGPEFSMDELQGVLCPRCDHAVSKLAAMKEQGEGEESGEEEMG